MGYNNALYAINADGTFKWSYTTTSDICSSPSIALDGTIFVGCDDFYLYAINADGSLKWKCLTGGILESSPAIGSGGTIYVGSHDGYLYAINPDGTIKWNYSTGGQVRSSPAVGADGTIYVGSASSYLYAINPDGTLKWKYDTGSAIFSSPAVDDVRGVLYVGNNTGGICSVDTAGRFRWQTALGSSGVGYSSPAVAYGNNMVYIGDTDGYFYVIEGDNGRIVCSNSHPFTITSPAIDDPSNNGGDYCVWYNKHYEGIHKICCSPTGIEEKSSCVEDRLHLYFNHSPFFADAKISFTLPENTHILLEVYDTSGRLIKRLAKGNYLAGEHTVEWDAEGIKGGIYFCRLRTGIRTLTRKTILMRR
jgi:outer membrane protein assembly factor BamB